MVRISYGVRMSAICVLGVYVLWWDMVLMYRLKTYDGTLYGDFERDGVKYRDFVKSGGRLEG